MRVTFLRDGALAFEPVPKDAPTPRLALKSPDAGASAEAVAFAVRAGDGPVVALISLGPLDWIRRTAGLTARGDVSEAMVRLAVRYAFEELNLERVDTDPVQAALATTLDAAGFAAAGDRWSCFKSPAV